MLIPCTRRLGSLFVALGIGLTGVEGSVILSPAAAQASSRVALKVRRYPGRVDVVVAGLGPTARVVSQRTTDSLWTGHIQGTDEAIELEQPQRLSLPDVGLSSIRLTSSESGYELKVQTSESSILDTPTVTSDGTGVIVSFKRQNSTTLRSSGRLDLSRPGRVNQPVYVPPMRPRAVAPPLGDMAVGTMLINNRSFVKASGPPVSLTLNNAPAKDALMSMARLGGYGFVFVGDGADGASAGENTASTYPVSMAFRNERYDRALNSVLMASGLQGRLDGSTLLVGTAVSAKSFGPQMSKVFRLNQVEVESASKYLGNLGALIQVANTKTTTSRESETSGTSSNSSESSTSTTSMTTEVDTYGSGVGPLLGLVGTTDARLNTITLVGDPSLINVAQSYLKQIDLRKRQVAVKVQILTVSLTNDKTVDASFSARMGDTYIVSQSGKAHMNFGRYKPGNPSGTGVYADGEYGTPGSYQAKIPGVQAQQVLDPLVNSQSVIPPTVDQQTVNQPYVEAQDLVSSVDPETGKVTTELVPRLDELGRPIYVPSTDPNASPQLVPVFDATGQPINVPSTNPAATPTLVPVYDSNGQPILVPSTDPRAAQTLKPIYDKNGQPVYVPGKDPAKFRYPDNSFFAYIEALIVSSSAKTLAQPTLLVQEGETAEVETGQNVITGVSSTDTANGSTQFQNTRENAGLKVDVKVNKIDDNGFITLNLNPEISVPVPAGVQQGVPIFNIAARKLKSGNVRLRDGQSLILTGVISDSDRQQVRKWPILGDMPLIGQLFRQTASSREKNELVVIVTPTVIDDTLGGRYGYGYRPGTAAGRRLVQSEQ